jgi:acyl carrier protein
MGHTGDGIRDRLRQFILDNYLPDESPANLTDDTPLRTSGVLDSMATLALVTFVEKTWNIELEAHETGIESFNTIGSIASLIESRGKA